MLWHLLIIHTNNKITNKTKQTSLVLLLVYVYVDSDHHHLCTFDMSDFDLYLYRAFLTFYTTTGYTFQTHHAQETIPFKDLGCSYKD